MAIKITLAPSAEPVTLLEAKAHLRVDVTDDDLLITNLISAARVHAENVCRRAFVTQKWDLYLDSFPKYTYYGVVPGYVPVDQLPSGWLSMRNYAVRFRGGKIDIPFPPLQSVDAVKYVDVSPVTGIAAVGSTGTTLNLAPTASALDNFYQGALVSITAGTGAGQLNTIASYAGATRIATVTSPWDTVPDASSSYSVSGFMTVLKPSQYVVDNISEPGAITPAPDTYWPDTQNRTNAVQISFTTGYGAASTVPAGIKAWILMRIGALYENREEVLVGQRLVVADLPFVDRLLDPYRIAGYI
jgi:hypothetical protein